jgi:hypothetical protein
VGDLGVLAIPALLVTGLVLLGLGASGRSRPARSGRWVPRFQDWATQVGVCGVRPWHVVGVCGGVGSAAGLAVLAATLGGGGPPPVGRAGRELALLAVLRPLGALRVGHLADRQIPSGNLVLNALELRLARGLVPLSLRLCHTTRVPGRRRH